eukprot:scaffold695_cov196-Alexandrium_tamarense.AAC.28
MALTRPPPPTGSSKSRGCKRRDNVVLVVRKAGATDRRLRLTPLVIFLPLGLYQFLCVCNFKFIPGDFPNPTLQASKMSCSASTDLVSFTRSIGILSSHTSIKLSRLSEA